MNERDLAALVLWLAGLTLMMWRSRGGARLPCVAGAAVWCALPPWEPSLRTAWHVGLTAAFLVAGLAGPRVETGGGAAHRESRGGEDHDPADSCVLAQ